jgi:hypothetical protein
MSAPPTDWRTWLLFVFTNNDDVDRSMTHEELKVAVCREPDNLAVALLGRAPPRRRPGPHEDDHAGGDGGAPAAHH